MTFIYVGFTPMTSVSSNTGTSVVINNVLIKINVQNVISHVHCDRTEHVAPFRQGPEAHSSVFV